jgi:hypothetical protein
MSAVIRNQVVRLLRDALDELRVHPEAHSDRELVGLALLAEQYDRPELASRFVRAAFEHATRELT